MKRIKSYLMGGVTLLSALGIGYVMQFGLALPGGGQVSDNRVDLSRITPTSSAAVLPGLPAAAPLELALPGAKATRSAAGAEPHAPRPALPGEQAETDLACDVDMTATPAAGAMVSLGLTAPCHASERVTIHHHGMMFTEVTGPDGTLSVTVPVLSERATFLASFAGGDGASVVTDMTSLPFYDRVVVQWKGDAGLQLHAREYGAAYFSDGHVWADAAGDLGVAARGEGGFLKRLGRGESPDALMAEVYSFPTGTAREAGDVALTVEAEVTARNCETRVEAQTLEIRDGQSLRVRDLVLNMPECDTAGDFLVLKNLVRDMKIAAR